MVEQRIHEIIREFSEKDRFSGVVLVQKDDEVLFHRAYGYASRAWKILNSTNMLFATGSVTKMFTAVAILQLIDSGLLSLNTKVQNILKLERPSLPPEITIKHLLMHTSGLPEYYGEHESSDFEFAQLWEHRPNYSTRHLSDFLPLIPNRMPEFQPGEKYSYCNTGYIILGLLIEKIAEQSYFSYVKQNVFTKAGMRRSGFLPLDHTVENVADGHIALLDGDDKVIGWKRNIFSVPLKGSSDGGAYSTSSDMLLFLNALRNGKLLSEELTKQILTGYGEVVQDDDLSWAYGFGVAFLLDGTDVIRYGHSGDDPGVSTKAFHYPLQNIDLVILGNQTDCATEIANRLHEMIMMWQKTVSEQTI